MTDSSIRRLPATELPPEKVARIVLRLNRGDAKSKIAREERASRTTVIKISRGEHISQRNQAPTFQRCPGCGGLAILPCRACEVRMRA